MNDWKWYTVTLRVEWSISMSQTISGDLVVRTSAETTGHAIGRVIQSLPAGMKVLDARVELPVPEAQEIAATVEEAPREA